MKYKVKLLGVSDRHNKVYKKGDTVTADRFNPRHVAILVRNGHLEPIRASIKGLKVGVLTALWQRHDLTKEFFKHWNIIFSKFSDVEFVPIAVGSEGGVTRKLTTENKWGYIECDNKPLGNKWNYGVRQFKNKQVDYVMCLGSDDFIGEKLMKEFLQSMAEGYDVVGVLDCYLFDQKARKLVYWGGYDGQRSGKVIGLGRCLSSGLLSKLGYAPWNGQYNSRLDGSMDAKLKNISHKLKAIRIGSKGLFCVDVKSGTNITPFQDSGIYVKLESLKQRVYGHL